MKKIVLFVAILGIIVFISFLVWGYKKSCKKEHTKQPIASCSAEHHKCGAEDPVNEPDYNMKNIIKQSILLEEHLAESNKYCESCIVKHFQHIIGLAEEAVWLAGTNLDKYPYLEDSPHFYQSLFEKWLKRREEKEFRQHVLFELRERRRNLIDHYYLE